MHVKISELLLKYANFKSISLFVALFVFFQLLVFPHFLNRIGPGEGHPIPDLIFGFSVEQANAFLSHVGEEGRKAYMATLLWIDSIYPLVYSVMLSLGIGKIIKKIPEATNKYSRINLIPFIAALSDYLENAGIIVLLLAYPNKVDMAAQLASVFGIIKWSMVMISIGIILLSLFYFVFFSKNLKANRTDSVET